jgi:hypothetical protein
MEDTHTSCSVFNYFGVMGGQIRVSRNYGAKGLVSQNEFFFEPEDANADEECDLGDIER